MTAKFYQNLRLAIFFLSGFIFSAITINAQGFEGYYRYPTIHNNQVYFVAEADIWTVPLTGGLAQRITTHAESEQAPRISPDGKTLAFTASYEGPSEVYTMPVDGGIPKRWTYESDFSLVNTWTPDGKLVYDTRAYSTLPNRQLVEIDLGSSIKTRVELSQASEASYSADGKTVFFVRPSYHGNVTKRYKGGTARQIWKYTNGAAEAVKLTTDFAGGSHHPMWWNSRVYFITDRDGTMNIWSMQDDGSGLTQHTTHEDFDIRYASLHNGQIVYQLGADVWHYNSSDNNSKKIDIRLLSDMDQLRERWVDNPSQYITSVYPDPKGNRVVITARGRAFIAPVKNGRFVEFTNKEDVRLRDAIFTHDGNSIITLSDESGEFEFVELPASGVGNETQLTKDGDILRYAGIPSPDGKWLAYDDLSSDMWVLDLATKKRTKISTNDEGIYSFSWSPDSKWVAFVQQASNTMAQVHLYNVETSDNFPVTSDRANSRYPKWSPDGEFLYLLSDRNFRTIVRSPWGPRQPEPYFDVQEKLYHISLKSGTRSPFRANDELYSAPDSKSENGAVVVRIDKAGIQDRITEVPIKAGNYRGLEVTKEAIYTLSSGTGVGSKTSLAVAKITNEDPKITDIAEGIGSFQLTQDGKKLLLSKGRSYFMVKAGTSKISSINDSKIDLSSWRFSITPQQDWEQIFTDAWRMERDYFYDKNMHGVNWKGMHDKYFPLVKRVTTRNELSDLIGRFVGELSALHTSVRGGDSRQGQKNVQVASLGARLSRDAKAGGYRIDYIYQADPDYPNEKSPLDDPYLDIRQGDVISQINGEDALSSVDIGELIRNQAGKQVRLQVKRGSASKDVIVEPMGSSYNLRYRDWEYTRRLEVEKASNNSMGYVHLRAMGSNDINQWYREFYPVFDRPGLIIDVRSNRGGNIESFILEKLLRQAWMYWKSRSGKPYWNMQYAFRGHIVILVNENTASDGEAFADGFKKLNLGTAIGTRTWGGEIWLSSSNRLSDGGLARAPMMGVYGPDGDWLIEGHGFDPDIEVDNLPHATFNGEDKQLEAAIAHLKKLIAEDPRSVPPPPAYPDKSFGNNKN